ncbi:hypothetical protein F5B20DRAFT_527865 [Whalleya microplaca]|nr:hypothetical protein F5B20DRAFT_527865 [Whalleya microplaca]
MMVLQDGKVAKLRAACDACNESKVRCSQTKPQCGRCARQGVPCVYGLSRRSHKSAPRIGTSGTTSENFVSRNIDPILLRRPSDTSGGSISTPATERATIAPSTSVVGGLGLTKTSLQNQPATPDDVSTTQSLTVASSAIDLMPNFDMYVRLLADSGSSDLINSFEPAFDLLADASTATSDLLTQYLPPPGSSSSYTEAGGSHGGFLSPRTSNEPQGSASNSCNCNTLVVRQLLSLPFQLEDEVGGLDVSFAQLKQAIQISEECISCTCTSRDEMSIMTTSTLIGRIIEGFEIFMIRANPLSGHPRLNTSDGSGDSPSGNMVPRLSWGVLQIEPDEEAELQQHMWLIQLRKLQRVIKKLGVAVSLLKSAQDSGNSAHMMTCQCIHIWLMQKAETLKDSYLTKDTDGAKGNVSQRRSIGTEQVVI